MLCHPIQRVIKILQRDVADSSDVAGKMHSITATNTRQPTQIWETADTAAQLTARE